MTDAEMIAWIDGASYEELLRKWRETPAGGSPFFRYGPVFDHYEVTMKAKQAADPDAAVAASKRIGW